MSTDIQKLDAAVSGTSAASAVDYATYPNAMPASREAAPRLGRAFAESTAGQKEVYAKMKELGYQMGEAEAVRTWNATGMLLKDRIPKDGKTYDLGFVRFFPALAGTFDSADAEFDPERNRLYVAAAPSADIRNALSGGTPTRIGWTAANDAFISDVTLADGSGNNVIKSGEPFRINGAGLTRNVGDESAELALPDGSTVSVTLSDPEGGTGTAQRLIGRLAEDVDACEGAVLTVRTHGFSPDSELQVVTSSKLTILAGETPTGPTLTGVHAPGIESPMIHENSGTWFDGTGLDGWTGGENDEILAKNNRAEEAEWTRVDLHEDIGGEVVFNDGTLKMDEGAWDLLSAIGIVEGSEVRFKVTIAGQSAEIVATVAEA